MKTTVTRQYSFEAGHWLPNVPEGHKCKRPHGHNYVLEISATGEVRQDTGFIIDFWDLDKLVQPLIDLMDHQMLNEIAGLSNPTAEHIAAWFYRALGGALSIVNIELAEVKVYETPRCWACVS